MEKRGLAKGGRVVKVTDKTFNDKDKKDFNTNWTLVLCKRGAIRITMPHLPYSALGPAKGRQQTMLPWFVSLQNDYNALEIVEGGI